MGVMVTLLGTEGTSEDQVHYDMEKEGAAGPPTSVGLFLSLSCVLCCWSSDHCQGPGGPQGTHL